MRNKGQTRRSECKLFVSTGDNATGWQRTKTGRVLERIVFRRLDVAVYTRMDPSNFWVGGTERREIDISNVNDL